VSLAAAAGFERAPSLAGAVLTSHLANGMLHIRQATASHRYNPGLASALLLAPLGGVGTAAMLKDPEIRKRQALAGMARGGLASAALVSWLRARASSRSR
jgi:hypothetical protein